MAKSRYRFNPDSLSFDKMGVSVRAIMMKIITYFFAGVVIAVVFNFAFGYFFDSPKEKMLKRENDQMKLQYEVMERKLDQVAAVIEDLQQRDDNIYRSIFEAEPIPRSVREAGFGGVNRYADLEGYESSDVVVTTAKKLDKILKQVYIQSKSYDEIIPLAMSKEQMLRSIPAIQPVANKGLERTSSGFGMRIHPWYKIKVMHSGQDFAAPIGTPIYATGDGVIESCEHSYSGYGNNIIINHGFGYKTLYGHMSVFRASQGQRVKRGDIIGEVGNTGLSTGPHVHYEVIKNGEKVNPINYFYNDLSPQQYEQIITISSNTGQAFD